MSPTFVCTVDRDLGRLELLLVAPGCTVQVPHEVAELLLSKTSFSDSSLPPLEAVSGECYLNPPSKGELHSFFPSAAIP
jgi:hypothetical protein